MSFSKEDLVRIIKVQNDYIHDQDTKISMLAAQLEDMRIQPEWYTDENGVVRYGPKPVLSVPRLMPDKRGTREGSSGASGRTCSAEDGDDRTETDGTDWDTALRESIVKKEHKNRGSSALMHKEDTEL